MLSQALLSQHSGLVTSSVLKGYRKLLVSSLKRGWPQASRTQLSRLWWSPGHGPSLNALHWALGPMPCESLCSPSSSSRWMREVSSRDSGLSSVVSQGLRTTRCYWKTGTGQRCGQGVLLFKLGSCFEKWNCETILILRHWQYRIISICESSVNLLA